ncbi:MAG TPA: MarR family transcriptional regulator [Casimicrobiaceae bacterium]|nr:MarR family transcriptional regulator [Casimicrobiaceae bacterium]
MEATTTRTSTVYDAKSFEPQLSIGRKIGRVKAAMTEAMDRELAPFDITSAQFVILVSLATGEADSAAELCRGISYDPGAMTRMIDRLEQKELIRRAQLPDDRRKVGLELTPEGKAVYPKLRAASAAVQNRFLRGFTRSEVRQLELFMQRMLSNS